MSAHADAHRAGLQQLEHRTGRSRPTCARCHSSEGFIDYIGGDGSAPGVVDKPAPTKSVIRCVTCHNPAADALSSVTFPSGVTVDGLGGEARCMTCHQGRSSGPAVDAAIAAAAPRRPTTPSARRSTSRTSTSSRPPPRCTPGARKGGYQYAGQVYDVRFRHVDGYDTCIGCHDPHSTQVKFDACAGCHTGVTDVGGAHEIRMMSSVGIDYDGDGNTSEGIYDELVGLRDKLGAAIRTLRRRSTTRRSATPPTAYPVLVRRRRRRRQLLGRRGGGRQRLRELDRAPRCAPPTTSSWRARIRAPSPTTPSTSSSCSTTRSPTSTARWSPRST